MLVGRSDRGLTVGDATGQTLGRTADISRQPRSRGSRAGNRVGEALAERVREATVRLALPNARAPGQQLTVSIGVATTDVADATAQDLMARADAQLYAAKRAGRNRVHAAVAPRA